MKVIQQTSNNQMEIVDNCIKDDITTTETPTQNKLNEIQNLLKAHNGECNQNER